VDNVLPATCSVLGIDPESVYYNFSFVSQPEIKRLNKQFRGINRITDVLSFPDGDTDPETNKKFLGDILICRSVAKRQAELYGQTPEREITFLKIHGLLHLFGFDHQTESDEKIMREKQRAVLAVLNELAIK
jgi:probable rRNA maturation factor